MKHDLINIIFNFFKKFLLNLITDLVNYYLLVYKK